MENIIRTILIIAALAVLSYFSFQRVDRYLELKAVDDCAREYQTEYTDVANNTKITRPLEAPFTECVWEKGVRTWHGTKN